MKGAGTWILNLSQFSGPNEDHSCRHVRADAHSIEYAAGTTNGSTLGSGAATVRLSLGAESPVNLGVECVLGLKIPQVSKGRCTPLND